MTESPRHPFTGRGLGRFQAAADGGQPFDVPTRTVRLLLRDPDEHSPRRRRCMVAARRQSHRRVARSGVRTDPTPGRTERIAFDWNALSVSQRGIDAPDGIDIVGPAPDQPSGLMYVYGSGELRLRLLIIAPTLDADRAYEDMQKAVAPDLGKI